MMRNGLMSACVRVVARRDLSMGFAKFAQAQGVLLHSDFRPFEGNQPGRVGPVGPQVRFRAFGTTRAARPGSVTVSKPWRDFLPTSLIQPTK